MSHVRHQMCPEAVSAGQTDALADKLGIKLAARDLSTPSQLTFDI